MSTFRSLASLSIAIAGVMVISSSPFARADDHPSDDHHDNPGFVHKPDGDHDQDDHNKKGVSWEEFKEHCRAPGKLGDVQVFPQQIEVQCTEVSRGFVAGAPGEFVLPGSRVVKTYVGSDKFFVDADDKTIDPPAEIGSCPRFKEIETRTTVSSPLSCADVLAVKGDKDDLCFGVLGRVKGLNPKLSEVHETGRVINSCAGLDGVVEVSDVKSLIKK